MVLMFLIQTILWPGSGLLWQHGFARPSLRASVLTSNATPWGELECTPVALDRPDDYFTNDLPASLPATRWIFPGHSAPQLQKLLADINFPSSARAWLDESTNWHITPRGIHLQPPATLVASLPPSARAPLYRTLARHPENFLQMTPFRFRTNGFDAWFADCGIPPEKVELVRSLTYEQDGSLCFADAPVVAALCSPEETKNIIKCLWRVSTFMIKVRVTPQTDVDALMKYWGTLGPAHEYKPLVESMARSETGPGISMTYFLPPFARLRLYTYPHPRDPTVMRQDCFWSAMNFFNSTPDDGFFDPGYTQKVLERDYARVRDDSRRFGDLIMLVGANSQALHMCVFIADDFVFTKNGANPQQPWVLMKLSEMLAQYEKDRPYQLRVFRRTAPVPLSAVQEFSATTRTL